MSRVTGGALDLKSGDLDLRAGWGFVGKDGAVMAGAGRIVERDYTPEEREAIEVGCKVSGFTTEGYLSLLGAKTLDVYLNDVAYWRNLPSHVWEFTIGGYQVIKKWLSYREFEVHGRGLSIDEAREAMTIARRIAALLLLQRRLDHNYLAVKQATFNWSSVTPD